MHVYRLKTAIYLENNSKARRYNEKMRSKKISKLSFNPKTIIKHRVFHMMFEIWPPYWKMVAEF
jgi:hypothetical protein